MNLIEYCKCCLIWATVLVLWFVFITFMRNLSLNSNLIKSVINFISQNLFICELTMSHLFPPKRKRLQGDADIFPEKRLSDEGYNTVQRHIVSNLGLFNYLRSLGQMILMTKVERKRLMKLNINSYNINE